MDNDYKLAVLNINKQAPSFYEYLRTFILDKRSWELLMILSAQAKVYIFSGVIRNFLLGYLENRDLDIVVETNGRINLPLSQMRLFEWSKNSFGGLKVKVGSLNVDFWNIKDTWGIKEERKPIKASSLVDTAFFNFSAIVYDFNKRKFIFREPFVSFYTTHTINIVYEKNPDIPLCIVNSIYYASKYKFKLSRRLCEWLVKNYNEDMDYSCVQIRHWGYVRYSRQEIKNIIRYITFCLLTK